MLLELNADLKVNFDAVITVIGINHSFLCLGRLLCEHKASRWEK